MSLIPHQTLEHCTVLNDAAGIGFIPAGNLSDILVGFVVGNIIQHIRCSVGIAPAERSQENGNECKDGCDADEFVSSVAVFHHESPFFMYHTFWNYCPGLT